MSLWTRAFWKAALERMVRGFAIGMLLVVGLEDHLNVLETDWSQALGYGLGGAVLSLLFSLAGNAVSGNGPSFIKSETVEPEYGTSLAEREAQQHGYVIPNVPED